MPNLKQKTKNYIARIVKENDIHWDVEWVTPPTTTTQVELSPRQQKQLKLTLRADKKAYLVRNGKSGWAIYTKDDVLEVEG